MKWFREMTPEQTLMVEKEKLLNMTRACSVNGKLILPLLDATGIISTYDILNLVENAIRKRARELCQRDNEGRVLKCEVSDITFNGFTIASKSWELKSFRQYSFERWKSTIRFDNRKLVLKDSSKVEELKGVPGEFLKDYGRLYNKMDAKGTSTEELEEDFKNKYDIYREACRRCTVRIDEIDAILKNLEQDRLNLEHAHLSQSYGTIQEFREIKTEAQRAYEISIKPMYNKLSKEEQIKFKSRMSKMKRLAEEPSFFDRQEIKDDIHGEVLDTLLKSQGI